MVQLGDMNVDGMIADITARLKIINVGTHFRPGNILYRLAKLSLNPEYKLSVIRDIC